MEKTVSAGTLQQLARTLRRTVFTSSSSSSASRSLPPFLSPTKRPTTSSCCRPAHAVRSFSSTASTRYADQPPKDGPSSVQDALSGLNRSSDNSSSTNPTTPAPLPASSSSPAPSSRNLMENLADLLPSSRTGDAAAGSAASRSVAAAARAAAARMPSSSHTGSLGDFDRMRREVDSSTEEYHFAVYSHKHNTHITVSKPNRDVILSVSCGNLGFRKSHRKSFDAAYQLGAYVCDRLYQRNWHKTIQKMEVTLRGFGQGREAVSKILLGTEGRLLRNKITRVADNTRLKFGGTRSKKPRRLG
ncbi:37S ribosomal protein [Niveomyces insectorum RCEF 264]|uniref:37S ribosomal protein n=1 Tax=Niveomyces insectorum RCEF 264 TaxID=1081102 RepID=A0A167XVD6_9HYPO|nr:37S ribosomal protein [Niveomyces insectorum RCEF 264]